MKAIVFGGSGFLGSHVADRLTACGHEVTIFDLTPSKYLINGQEMFVGSILDSQDVEKAILGQDYVFNFAGIADLDDATTKPLYTAQLNIIGNINIMDACVKSKIQRYIYASSIYVYSQKGGFYRCSKQASELYVEEYQQRFDLPFTILRYGTLYGQRADHRNSVYKYLKQVMESDKIVCNGSGEEVRYYINVKDAARLSVDILKDEYQNQHIILSGHEPIKLVEMISTIKEILNKDIPIIFAGKKSRDHYDFTPYSFTPKIGYKLVNHLYLDIGQGLLECLHEMNDSSAEKSGHFF